MNCRYCQAPDAKAYERRVAKMGMMASVYACEQHSADAWASLEDYAAHGLNRGEIVTRPLTDADTPAVPAIEVGARPASMQGAPEVGAGEDVERYYELPPDDPNDPFAAAEREAMQEDE